MMIKDAMVVIHLAKITLLEKSCQHFKEVMVPKAVYDEILAGKEKGHPDVGIFRNLVRRKKITVKSVRRKELVKKAKELNIQGGEAEAVALYWQENADYIATDDDNVRRKHVWLNARVIGTPAIILTLYKKNAVGKEKFAESLRELRKIGWFSDAVIDATRMEGLKWEDRQ